MGNFWDAPMKREGEAVEYDPSRKNVIYLTTKQPNGLYMIERLEFMKGETVVATDLTLEEAEAILRVKGDE